MQSSTRFYVLGIIFAAVWSSASVAAKIGLKSVQPLVLYQGRFTLAAACMLFLIYLIQRNRLPKGKEWGQLALFGFLNVTLALGFFVYGIREVAAGIGALQVGLNPLVISVLAAIVAREKIPVKGVVALFLGILGVAICVYPLLLESYATPRGLIFLIMGTLSYSTAAVFYSKIEWKIDKLTINGWQSFFGALFLFPATFLAFDAPSNVFNEFFFYPVFWLAIPLSVAGVYLWLWLLSKDTVRASFFLFLCPPFGLFYAYFILDEPFTLYTLVGLIIVMAAIYLGRVKTK